MRTIEPVGSFRRDLKRELKGRYGKTLSRDLEFIVAKLASDLPLAFRYRDHALSGDWSDHRDCHIRPDLVLIYRKPDDEVLQLVRLGSHSELRL